MAVESGEGSQIIVRYKGLEAEIVPLTPGSKVIIGFEKDGNLVVQSIPNLRGRQRLRSKQELSKRELEILEALANGQSPAEIAKDLAISLHTVRTHSKNINTKLNVRSKAAAIGVAYKDRLINRPDERVL